MTTLVVGCGYLGRRVAAMLVGRGERVIGTTRHPGKAGELAGMGIEPFALDVLHVHAAEPETPPRPRVPRGGCGLPSFDRLVYCVGFDSKAGPSRREVYVEGLSRFLETQTDRPHRFVYTSSTGVYGHDDGSWVTEDDPADPRTESGRVALEAETIARDHGAIVVRLAGLYGPGRIIRRAAIQAGEPIASAPAKRVNLVQVDDAASAVVAALDRGSPGRVYNVADDRPATRAELYGITARCLGAPAPTFLPAQAEEADRRIANRRMRDELGVVLTYPDVASGLPASISIEAEEGRVSPPPAR